MKSFFKKEEVQSLRMTQAKRLSCFNCGLYKGVKSPKMEPYGNFKKKIMIIGESPGKEEDRNGKPWQGKTGRLLQRTLEEIGIDLFEDCISVNAVNCMPPDNKIPSAHEINCCRDIKVLKALADYSPKKIILLGNSALISFLGHRWKKRMGTIIKWRGWSIPDQDYKAWVSPTFHPSYVERMNSKEVDIIWKNDLTRAIQLGKFPIYNPPEIRYIDIEEIPTWSDKGLAAFDYETTGIKPQAKGHKIACASMAGSGEIGYAFMMPKKKKKWKPFLEFLANKKIKKVASNMKYEDIWSEVILGTVVKGWHWDTMLTAHQLDNRPGICSLKFQAYIRLGIIDYDSEVSPYLQPTKEDVKKYGGNAINRIDELLAKPGGAKLLMEYCALDSVYEYRVAKAQMTEMEYRERPWK